MKPILSVMLLLRCLSTWDGKVSADMSQYKLLPTLIRQTDRQTETDCAVYTGGLKIGISQAQITHFQITHRSQ